jgi:hypothetical protein
VHKLNVLNERRLPTNASALLSGVVESIHCTAPNKGFSLNGYKLTGYFPDACVLIAEVQRQLEAVLPQLKDTEDPKLRREKLLYMRLLLTEADRLMLASSDE